MIFVLPSYSPDLNPTEQLWNHTKSNGVGRQPISGPENLKKAVISKLRGLQKLPSKVASFLGLSGFPNAFLSNYYCLLKMTSRKSSCARMGPAKARRSTGDFSAGSKVHLLHLEPLNKNRQISLDPKSDLNVEYQGIWHI